MHSWALRGRLLAASLLFAAIQAPAAEPTVALPSEMAEKFTPTNVGFEFDRREAMIPMRDGVKLHTVILVPKHARNAPILLTRTPYNATELTSHNPSTHLDSVLMGYDNATDTIVDGGYIRVIQDVRGKYGSEGDYVMNRPFRGPLNPTEVDHATDTWDSIDWLVKNIPESNGKVGILGISYDGFTTLAALVDPHPALKAAAPMNPMVDGWTGDDWFHHGAFRQTGIDYVYEQDATRDNKEKWYSAYYDDYDQYMHFGAAGPMGRAYGMDQVGFWTKLVAHPAYDSFWQLQAMDKILAKKPVSVPTLLVHSLFDQEDIYGAPAVYKALKTRDPDHKLFLAMGPWRHGGEIGNGSSLGAVTFDSDTAKWFRREVLAPFFAHYLKDESGSSPLPAPVTAFETGANEWHKLPAWPPAEAAPRKLYLHAGAVADFKAPAASEAASDDYVSDPAKPVTFRERPIRPLSASNEAYASWARWLVDDQRFAASRPDVLTYASEVLTEPVTIAGEPVANLIAATTGTDGDFIVKLIDAYPDETPDQPAMGGYQLAVSMDILRGRYRESVEQAKPITPNVPLAYRLPLPNTYHVFRPGHRIMVQIQSSWFPLYDRNPQSFVPNIFEAKPADYRRATVTLFHSAKDQSFIELPVIK